MVENPVSDALAPLTKQLGRLCDRQPFMTSWFLEDLRSGATADRDGDRETPSASTRKVGIMMATLRAVHQGRLDLDQPVVIDERFREEIYSGCLQHLTPGLTMPLRDAVALMIIVSDNLCTPHVVELVGLDAVNAFCENVGLHRTHHRNAIIGRLEPDHPLDATNSTSAADQARLYRLILQGALDPQTAAILGCSPTLCALALDILHGQLYRDGIAALLPPMTPMATKNGLGWRDVSDGGIVFDGDDPAFILTVYTDQVPETLPDGLPGTAVARGLIADLGRACWEHIVLTRREPATS
ncbi:MAG: serine hydrolase [Haloechinothrix sp.]